MIFGAANLTNIPASYEIYYEPFRITLSDPPSGIEVFANYSVGIVMIACFFASWILNPIVFYYNWQQSSTNLRLTRDLFMILAMMDTLTNAYKPLLVANHALSAHVFPVIENGTAWDVIDTMIIKSAGIASIQLTAIISCCRFINVRFPFYQIKCYVVLGVFAVVQALMIVFFFEITVGFTDAQRRLDNHEVHFFLYCQLVYSFSTPGYDDLIALPAAAFPAVISLLGVVFSASTCWVLMSKPDIQSSNSNQDIRKSTLAIAVMNIGSLVTAVFCSLYQVYGPQLPFVNFLGACGCYIILSVVNPLVRISCSRLVIKL